MSLIFKDPSPANARSGRLGRRCSLEDDGEEKFKDDLWLIKIRKIRIITIILTLCFSRLPRRQERVCTLIISPFITLKTSNYVNIFFYPSEPSGSSESSRRMSSAVFRIFSRFFRTNGLCSFCSSRYLLIASCGVIARWLL